MKQTVSGWWVIWLIPVNAHFSVSFAINSLIRSNVFWKTMMVDKVFCKSTNAGLDSSRVSREDKSTSRISVYSSKKKMLSFHDGESNVINLLPSGWLVPPGNGAILGTQELASAADYVLRIGHKQVGLMPGSSHCWVHIEPPCHHCHFVEEPIGQFWGLLDP